MGLKKFSSCAAVYCCYSGPVSCWARSLVFGLFLGERFSKRGLRLTGLVVMSSCNCFGIHISCLKQVFIRVIGCTNYVSLDESVPCFHCQGCFLQYDLPALLCLYAVCRQEAQAYATT